jgi:O-antigen ligase
MALSYNVTMKNLEIRLLQLAVFLIPANMAYHWYTNEAYVNGHLIDYLLPKLYLSFIPMLILNSIFLYRFLRSRVNVIQTSVIAALTIYLCITSLTSPRPIAALWFLFQLVSLGLFATYLLKTYRLKDLLKHLQIPLIAGMTVQSITGLMQYIMQSSLIGYIYLGEPNLSGIASIAKDSFSGAIKILPYGTTAHPNVLAGYLAIGVLLLIIASVNLPKRKGILNLSIFTICLTLPILLLTRSQAALISMIIAISIGIYYQIKNNVRICRSTRLVSFSTLVAIVIFGGTYYHSINLSDSDSVMHRYRLIQVGIKTFQQDPVTGTGLNQSIVAGTSHGLITNPAPFLQPVHNIYMLWLIETGVVGVILLLILFKQAFLNPQNRLFHITSLPLLALLIIGLVDHYPITLSSGQLLLTVSCVLALSKA